MKKLDTYFHKAFSTITSMCLLLSMSFNAHSQEFHAGLNLGYLPCQGSNYYSVGGNFPN